MILGYVISVPLILVSADGLFAEVTSKMDITIPAVVSNINVVISFAIIVVTYYIAQLLSRKKVLSISMADCLKNRAE